MVSRASCRRFVISIYTKSNRGIVCTQYIDGGVNVPTGIRNFGLYLESKNDRYETANLRPGYRMGGNPILLDVSGRYNEAVFFLTQWGASTLRTVAMVRLFKVV